MKKTIVTVILSICALFMAQAQINIIPQPSKISRADGKYVLPASLTISYNSKSLEPAAFYLREILSPATGYDVNVKKGGKGDIRLEIISPADMENESYSFASSEEGITIKSASYKGIIHGVSTLRQLLPYQIEFKSVLRGVDWSVPCVTIEDNPSYEWRGLMLDPVRHFFSMDETKKLLDVMCLYKFSKFHWHLIDSQGWRVEIKKYPLLTEKGAWRDPEKENLDVSCQATAVKDHNPDMALPKEHFRMIDGKLMYGGFYTQDDIREIVEYAAVRGIDVVPEIDMPGHNLAATQCYPELSCGHDGTDPLCLGNDHTLDFARDVFAEIFSLFPYKFAEIGGDEVNRTKWSNCALCQERIKKENLAGLEELQSWFTREMEKFFNANGRRLIGWDEILEGGVSPTAIVNWWQGYHKDVVHRSTDGGNEVICCPNGLCYLDYGQHNEYLHNVYTGPIVPADLTAEQHKLIKGIQGNIWTEYIPSEGRMQYMAFPRALAIAERSWSTTENQNWDCFISRLQEHLNRLSTMDVKYRPLVE